MKISIIIVFVGLLLPLCGYSQKIEKKLEFNAFSITPLSYYSDSFDSRGEFQIGNSFKKYPDTGLAFGTEVSFIYMKKHLFSLGVATGSEFNIIVISNSFTEINAHYGREFALSRILFLEVHLGTGYFNFSSRFIDSESRGKESLSTIGFPLATKIRIMTGDRFSIGLVLKGNFNTIKTIYTGGLILQWNRKRTK